MIPEEMINFNTNNSVEKQYTKEDFNKTDPDPIEKTRWNHCCKDQEPYTKQEHNTTNPVAEDKRKWNIYCLNQEPYTKEEIDNSF